MDHSAYNTRPAESRLSLDNFEVFWPKVFYINYFLTLIISTNIILSRVSAADPIPAAIWWQWGSCCTVSRATYITARTKHSKPHSHSYLYTKTRNQTKICDPLAVKQEFKPPPPPGGTWSHVLLFIMN